jgi:hypothetical protein
MLRRRRRRRRLSSLEATIKAPHLLDEAIQLVRDRLEPRVRSSLSLVLALEQDGFPTPGEHRTGLSSRSTVGWGWGRERSRGRAGQCVSAGEGELARGRDGTGAVGRRANRSRRGRRFEPLGQEQFSDEVVQPLREMGRALSVTQSRRRKGPNSALTRTLVRGCAAAHSPPSVSTTSRILRYTSNCSSPVPSKISPSLNGSNTTSPSASTVQRDKVKSIKVALMPERAGESGTVDETRLSERIALVASLASSVSERRGLARRVWHAGWRRRLPQ